jgi:hemerythrin superfamily protein
MDDCYFNDITKWKKRERERERKEHWYRVVLTHCNGEADLISISHGLMS